MRILIVCSGNSKRREEFDFKSHQVFIYEQVESLRQFKIDFDFFFVKEKGIIGYLKHYFLLKKELKNKYDLIHAHNGLCGILSNLQRKIPVITTYHGTDLNKTSLRLISYISILTSARNILVSRKQLRSLLFRRKITIIPCGVDRNIFYPVENINRSRSERKRILFSSSFSNRIKNYPLAKKALDFLGDKSIELIELKEKTREQVNDLLNDSELLLLTSFSEGSPQIIKEALACNCPIVSTDVGDVKDLVGNIQGCFITTFDPKDVSKKISEALEFAKTKIRTNGSGKIHEYGLDLNTISERIYVIYKEILTKT